MELVGWGGVLEILEIWLFEASILSSFPPIHSNCQVSYFETKDHQPKSGRYFG